MFLFAKLSDSVQTQQTPGTTRLPHKNLKFVEPNDCRAQLYLIKK